MKKSIGSNKLRTAVFISGKGSNFKNLINYSLKKNSIIDIKAVVSSNSKAKGLNKSVVIGHGISNNIAIKNMIILTADVVEADLPSKIKNTFYHE